MKQNEGVKKLTPFLLACFLHSVIGNTIGMITACVTIVCKCSTIIGCTIWHDYCMWHDFCKSYSVKTVHVHTRVPNEVKGRAGAREQLRSMTWDPRTRESSPYGNAPIRNMTWDPSTRESSLYGNAPSRESSLYGNAPVTSRPENSNSRMALCPFSPNLLLYRSRARTYLMRL